MERIGPMELLIIMFIVLIVFGAGKLPEIGGALGKSIRAFREESRGTAPEQTTTSQPTEPQKK